MNPEHIFCYRQIQLMRQNTYSEIGDSHQYRLELACDTF
jgi:hypothetical protein